MSAEETYDRNETRTTTYRRCPYCDKSVQSRGLYAHVMNTEDEVHGDYRSVPDGFNPREAEIVGEEEVEQDSEGVPEDEVANYLYLCTLCGNLLRGEMGYKVHLAKVAGDDIHPQDVDITDEYYVRIPADEDYEPIIPEERVEEIAEREVGGGDGSTVEPEQDDADDVQVDSTMDEGTIPVAALRELLNKFDGKGEAYDDAEEEVEEVIGRYSG